MKRQKMEQVKIDGRKTPAVLRSRGPKVSEARIARFERQLGYSLPPDYREFLLRYNGGEPVVGEVKGRDDRPDVPYQHGDGISTFLKLSCREGDLSRYEELRAPVEIPWSLPKNLLPIAEDGGGNCFVLELGQKGGCVRFLDHEALDEEITQHRVVADSFLDLLLRIVPVKAHEAKEQARSQRERRALQRRKFPAQLAAQCRAVAKDHPEICEWCRTVCLKLFDQKGYFAVQDDALSRLLLDLMFSSSAAVILMTISPSARPVANRRTIFGL